MLDDNVLSLRPKCYLDCVCKNIHSFKEFLSGVLVEQNAFVRLKLHINLSKLGVADSQASFAEW